MDGQRLVYKTRTREFLLPGVENCAGRHKGTIQLEERTDQIRFTDNNRHTLPADNL